MADDLPNLTAEMGFKAMQHFLEAYWERGQRASNDLAILLTDLSDDPAQWDDWLAAVRKVEQN